MSNPGVKLAKTAPGFYRSADRRFSAVRSTRRVGDRGFRSTQVGYTLFDGPERVGYFLSLASAERAADKRLAGAQ